MPYFRNLKASPVDELKPSSQGLNIESSANLVPLASSSTIASQAQGTRQPQGLSSEGVHNTLEPWSCQAMCVASEEGADVESEHVDALIPSHAVVTPVSTASKLSNTYVLTSSARTQVGTEGKMTSRDARPQSTQSLLNGIQSSNTGPQASPTMSGSNLQTPSGKTDVAYGTSTSRPFLGIDSRPGILSGTQTIPATSVSQDELPSDRSVSLVSALGYGTSTSAQNLPISITQVLHTSDSTSSLLFGPTATPPIPNRPSPFTTSVQTVTSNTLGQYSIDHQTLTPGGVIMVSGSKISLAPNASELIIGTSTEALNPSISAHLGSGSNGTEVQQFTGYAMGATDGLWSSSSMLLISFLLMLWI